MNVRNPRFLASLAAGAAGCSLVAALVVRFAGADVQLPKEEIDALARASRGTSNSAPPLQGYTSVVTGATAGLGKDLAEHLLSMGATVVLVSRSKSKLEGVVAEFRKRHPEGKLDLEVADLSDLEATGKAAARIASRYEAIDLLVNNAGIHYSFDIFRLWKRPVSPQGYDMLFAANYLGHFLLTQVLGKRLRATANSRVLNVSSTYHWHGDDAQLWPVTGAGASTKMPLAGRCDFPGKFSKFRHMNLSYGNSKLAQILHARALQRAWGGPERGPRIMCACPGWARTDIIPDNPLGKILEGFAFSRQFGLNSLLGAIFLPAAKLGRDGDFVANSNILKFVCPQLNMCSRLASVTTLRDYLGHVLLMFFMLVYQRLTVGRFVQRTSPESYDSSLQDALYAWSECAVSPYSPP